MKLPGAVILISLAAAADPPNITCTSMTQAKFPILDFYHREGVEASTLRPLRAVSLGAFRDAHSDGLRVLLHHGAEVYGFDSPENCAEDSLNVSSPTWSNCGGRLHCIGKLVGDGSKHRFNYNPAFPWLSSLYKPSRRLWRHFVSSGCSLFQVQNVSTVRLDDLGLTSIDYLKLDIQGGELNALGGAEKMLRNVLVLQVEVSLEHVYEGQPLFGDVDRFLRQRGFTFHRLRDLRGLVLRPLHTDELYRFATHEMFGDAIYVRSMWGSLSPTEAIRTAWLLHELYQSYDVALHLLKLSVPSLARAYFSKLVDHEGLAGAGALSHAFEELDSVG